MHDLRRPAIVTSLAVALAATMMATASASSPAAWTQHEKDTRQACATASGLKDPVVHAHAALFDDTVGMDARLVTGTWKPAHMKGAKATMLCLYDRKSRRATTQDIEPWRSAVATPPKAPVTAPVAPPKVAPPKAPPAG